MSLKHKKHKVFLNKLKVWQPFSCIVAENVQMSAGIEPSEFIAKGSSIFCGCCGSPIGKLTSNLYFPFSFNTMKSRLANIGFRGKEFLQCVKCQQTLFDDILKMVITKLDNFIELQNKAISEQIVNDMKTGNLKESAAHISDAEELKQTNSKEPRLSESEKPKTKLRIQK